ncbi:MAG: heat-inducible transcriptional repressor HrcA [Bacilli bacterium]|jgi:heat-inducible transcriptional repressor
MITKRQKEILKIIVDEYIKTARPVGSKSICEKVDCSSATIRNEMSELEKIGYLEKTHTSSGRVPSEEGYRYYVDNLMEPKKMTGEDMLKLQTIFQNTSLELSDVISKSVQIISEMTSYTSVVLGEASFDNKLKKVEVVPLDENNLIAIVITDKGYVEHKNMFIEENISLEEIKKMVDLINNLLGGTLLNEIGEKLEFEIKPIIGKYVKQHEMIYNVFYNAFNDFAIKSTVQLTGRSNILKQPEFDNVEKVRNIIRKFEDQDLISNIQEDSDDINIYIGKESNIDEDVTIIKTGYNINNKKGTIAIIGPKRMEYNRVVALLEYIKENIER